MFHKWWMHQCFLVWLFQHLLRSHSPKCYSYSALELSLLGRLQAAEVRRSTSDFLDLKMSLKLGAPMDWKSEGSTTAICSIAKPGTLWNLFLVQEHQPFFDPRFQSMTFERCTFDQQLLVHNILTIWQGWEATDFTSFLVFHILILLSSPAPFHIIYRIVQRWQRTPNKVSLSLLARTAVLISQQGISGQSRSHISYCISAHQE